LSVYLFPKLTIPAIVANLVTGIYFLLQGYTVSENVAKYNSQYDYYKFIGWMLTLSAIALGIKYLFLGNKIIPKMSALVLGKKNLQNNSV
jgi:hypothetical protein